MEGEKSMTFNEFLKSGMLIFTATMLSALAFFGFTVARNEAAQKPLGMRAPARIKAGDETYLFLNKPFTYDGRTWKTFWHRLAAEPYADNKQCVIKVTIVSDIEKADTPEFALQLMNQLSSQQYVRKDWKEQRDILMMKALQEFFKQNPESLNALKNTGSQPIFVHIGDAHWGTGLDEHGENKLGKLLEDIRAK